MCAEGPGQQIGLTKTAKLLTLINAAPSSILTLINVVPFNILTPIYGACQPINYKSLVGLLQYNQCWLFKSIVPLPCALRVFCCKETLPNAGYWNKKIQLLARVGGASSAFYLTIYCTLCNVPLKTKNYCTMYICPRLFHWWHFCDLFPGHSAASSGEPRN